MQRSIRPLSTALAVLWASAVFGADNNRFIQIDYPGGSATQAWGINSRGDIVGFYTAADKSDHGFLTNGGSFRPIDYPGAAVTFANGVNPQGDIVGEFGETAASPHHGFLLSADGVYTVFNFPGAASTLFEGINSRGD